MCIIYLTECIYVTTQSLRNLIRNISPIKQSQAGEGGNKKKAAQVRGGGK